MAIEMLNAAIKAHVAHRVSEVQIRQFVESWALLECVQERMRNLMYAGREHGRAHDVDATPDVRTLVEKFKSVIGSTWAQAIQPNTTSHVTEGAQRTQLPWREVAAVMQRQGDEAPAAYVRKHVAELTPFFTWRA